jgi:ribosome-associated protein
VRSLVDSVVDQVRALDVRPIGVEGGDTGEWMLVDLGSVVVNVMVPSMRAYYDLERLWTTPGRGERTLQP